MKQFLSDIVKQDMDTNDVLIIIVKLADKGVMKI